MMKKLVLIGSYCNTPQKLKVLKTNLGILRKIDVHILLYSPIPLGEDLIDLVDYFFLDKRFSPDGDEMQIFWKFGSYDGISMKMSYVWLDSVTGGIAQTKSLIHLSRNLDYDLLYFLLYDVVLTSDLVHFIEGGEEGFFPFRARSEESGETVGDCATQIYSMKKNKVDLFDSLLNFSNIKQHPNAESFFKVISESLEIPIFRGIEVEDHIHTFRNWQRDFYNYSPFPDFKIFFQKYRNDPPLNTHVLIYDIEKPCRIFIRTNDDAQSFQLDGQKILEILPEYEKFEIWYDGIIFDVLESARKFPGGWWEKE